MLAEKILGLEKGLSRPDKKLVNSAYRRHYSFFSINMKIIR